MNKTNLIIGVIALVAFAVSGLAYFKPVQIPPLAASPGPDQYFASIFFGGLSKGNTAATSSTIATYTMSQRDLVNVATGGPFDTIEVVLGQAATWTLPATSTLTNLVPKKGMISKTCFMVNKSALTIAAGTGIDLESGTSTLVIKAGNIGCLEFARATSTDIHAVFSPFVDAD